MATVEHTHYIIGSVVGPHPFPMMVRDFQSVIGQETKQQCLEQVGRLPDVVVACVGGGSNAAGMFYPFVDDAGVELVGVEAGGRGAERRRARGDAQPRQARRAARHLQLRPAGRRRPDGRRALGLGRPRLPRRRPGAQLLEGQRPRALHQRRRRRGAGGASTCAAGWRASCRRWRRPTRSSRRCGIAAQRGRRTTSSWSASPAAATRTATRWPGWRARS